MLRRGGGLVIGHPVDISVGVKTLKEYYRNLIKRTHAEFKEVKSILTKPIPPNLNMESSFGAVG